MARSPAPAEGSTASPAATPQVATKESMRSGREAAADADARLCLEFPTNTQLIMCAEKYRPDWRRS
jgi:hypothetical protein